MSADVRLRTNQGFGASDVLLDYLPLLDEEPAPGGGSLPRMLPARPAHLAPGEGHLHVTVTLSGEGGVRSSAAIAVGLTGEGQLVPIEVTTARRQRRDDEELALIFDEIGLLP